jgi:hypothetical protein
MTERSAIFLLPYRSFLSGQNMNMERRANKVARTSSVSASLSAKMSHEQNYEGYDLSEESDRSRGVRGLLVLINWYW